MKKSLSKLLLLVTITTMLFCLVGCSGVVKLKTRIISGLTLKVPSDYEDFEVKEGFMVAAGPNASITLSPVTSSGGLAASWWTENNLKDMYNDVYTNIEIKSIKNDSKVDDRPAVYAEFLATDKNGDNFNVHLIVLYKDEGLLHINYVMFKQGEDCSTSQYIDEIVESIRIAK